MIFYIEIFYDVFTETQLKNEQFDCFIYHVRFIFYGKEMFELLLETITRT